MIVFLKNWREIGQPVPLSRIENTILEILSEIDCNVLSLSGGVDSSLLLYYLLKVKKNITAFTMGMSENHPDILYSKMIIEWIGRNVDHRIFIPENKVIKKAENVKVYKLFYEYVSDYTDGMIVGDGVDEFSCGYYSHQKNPTEDEYYYHLSRLVPDHLIPLDIESGYVKVYLPYIDKRFIYLMSQIPVSDKVDKKNRKKIIMSLAEDKLPSVILNRWKYGFCDVLNIKGESHENKTRI